MPRTWRAAPGRCRAVASNGAIPEILVACAFEPPGSRIPEESKRCFAIAANIADLLNGRPPGFKTAPLDDLEWIECGFELPGRIRALPVFPEGLVSLEHWEALARDLAEKLEAYSESP
jgi:hypothetical protein